VKLYCATTNRGKLREFRIALEDSFEVESLPGLASIPPCEETGTTFEENAIQKALYYSKHCDEYLFVDDSGLEVNALDGAPGVYSARFAGVNATDESNNQLLLERMRGVPDRTARFVCVVVLAESGRLLRTFRGEVEGKITTAPQGTNGFGYDSVFFYEPFGCTFGQAPLNRKMDVSHRSRALRAMREYLNHLGSDGGVNLLQEETTMNQTDPLLGPLESDEHREMCGVQVDVARAGEARVKRLIYPPGYHWAKEMSALIGSKYCMHAHVGFMARGQINVRFADGCVEEFKAPKFVRVEPGHEGWVVGDEPAVLIEFDFEGDTVNRLNVPKVHTH
jgi:XTP/dITP diphosphohydrolase